MISGVGLHTGLTSQIRLHPDEGEVRFRRGKQEIPARLDYVINTRRATSLGTNDAQVVMVEHLLAALYAQGWWQNLVIEVSSDEIPILDGSALPWLEALSALGEPAEPPQALTVTAPFSYQQGKTRLAVTPGEPSLCNEIAFDHPAIGKQCWCGTPEHYSELLSARTFGFLEDVRALRAAGLATAAALENVIVFASEGALQALRYPDEPVRHKALDVLGDLFLLGAPLAGQLVVHRGSHDAHIAFARALQGQGHFIRTSGTKASL